MKSNLSSCVHMVYKWTLLDNESINFNEGDNHKEDFTGFHQACANGHLQVVSLLLEEKEKVDVNSKTSIGITGFHLACQNGHKALVKKLIEEFEAKNIDINAEDIEGKINAISFLSYNFYQSCSLVMLYYFFKFCYCFPVFNYFETFCYFLSFQHIFSYFWWVKKIISGRNGFHYACVYNQGAIVELLWTESEHKNIELAAKDENYESGFHIACLNGSTQVVELFLQKEFNVDLNEANRYGKTAFHLACVYGQFEVRNSTFISAILAQSWPFF